MPVTARLKCCSGVASFGLLASKSGRLTMATTSPVRTSMTMPHAPMAWNSSMERLSSSRMAACTRTSMDRRSGASLVRSRSSKKRSTPAVPCASTSTNPDHVRGDPALRIAAAFRRLEVHAGDAEVVDRGLLGQGDVAGEVNELLAAPKAVAQLLLVEPGQRALQLGGGVGEVDHLRRVRVDGRGGQADGQDLAVAVHDGGAGARRGRVRRMDRGGHAAVGGHDRVGQAARDIEAAGRHGVKHGGAGQLQQHGAEQHREAAGRHQQPAAGLLQHGPARQVGRRDAHGLHHWQGGRQGRSGSPARTGRRGVRAGRGGRALVQRDPPSGLPGRRTGQAPGGTGGGRPARCQVPKQTRPGLPRTAPPSSYARAHPRRRLEHGLAPRWAQQRQR